MPPLYETNDDRDPIRQPPVAFKKVGIQNSMSEYTMTMFDEAVRQALATNSLSGADDLLGFKMDADAAIAEEEGLDDTSVEETSNQTCFLIIRGTLNKTIGTLEQVKQILWRVWQRLAYQEFEATSLHFDSDAARLFFVTGAEPQLCVTGEIRVEGPHYERLHRKDR